MDPCTSQPRGVIVPERHLPEENETAMPLKEEIRIISVTDGVITKDAFSDINKQVMPMPMYLRYIHTDYGIYLKVLLTCVVPLNMKLSDNKFSNGNLAIALV